MAISIEQQILEYKKVINSQVIVQQQTSSFLRLTNLYY